MEQIQVVMEEVRRSAEQALIRLDLGAFTITGPRENVIEVESLVAWSSTVNALYGEGYHMVSPAEYATHYEIEGDTVTDRIYREGKLFALFYQGDDGAFISVPLEGKDLKDDLGHHLE